MFSKKMYLISNFDIERIITFIEANADFAEPSGKIFVCRDPKDNPVLEAALSGKADFIVTGDKDLLSIGKFHNTVILTPREFLKFL